MSIGFGLVDQISVVVTQSEQAIFFFLSATSDDQ